MPTFMHQWRYKDEQVKEFITNPEASDRADVVRLSMKLFGGKLLAFYFCFGEFDGVAISEFDDEETALASIMSIFGQGRIQNVRSTTLFSTAAVKNSIQMARKVLKLPATP